MAPYFIDSLALQSFSFQQVNSNPLSYAGPLPETLPQLNISEEEHEFNDDDDGEWEFERLYPAYILHPNFTPHAWWYRCGTDDYIKKTAVTVPSGPPSFDLSRWYSRPDSNQHKMSTLYKCHLLSLPKELRLEIWTYVLTDPSVLHLAVEITRAPLSPSKSSLRFPNPQLFTSLRPARNAPIGFNLLLANKFIYDEALPILYGSVKFAPLDLEGIFPLFLDTLSPYGRSLIKHVKLRVPTTIYDIDLFGDPSSCLFHWAVTCAQVAKVEKLQDVEVEGFDHHESKRVRSGILNPLVKMKAKKIFNPPNDHIAYMRLAEAQSELVAQASARRIRTAIERFNRNDVAFKQNLSQTTSAEPRTSNKQFIHAELATIVTPHLTLEPEDFIVEQGPSGTTPSDTYPSSKQFTHAEIATLVTSHSTIDHDLTQVMGLRHDPPLYEDWEIVSAGSGAPTPKVRPASVLFLESDEEFLDTASTLVDVDDNLPSFDGIDEADNSK
ncbi:hypothetical protein CC80DRAFT_491788 [Byssothecium circinans]|uniref:DUF7730 domain-containing protein n=1 Tax=Byssothecium circinans TaxID=147558 RepID=A0A6A5TXW8_9PLEO|nr:hypothetical protein CC80DRAFT_491788 [Byssothecium circinans]